MNGPRVLHDGAHVPTLHVRYRCPMCETIEVLDAYNGPPRCAGSSETQHRLVFMVAEGTA